MKLRFLTVAVLGMAAAGSPASSQELQFDTRAYCYYEALAFCNSQEARDYNLDYDICVASAWPFCYPTQPEPGTWSGEYRNFEKEKFCQGYLDCKNRENEDENGENKNK